MYIKFIPGEKNDKVPSISYLISKQPVSKNVKLYEITLGVEFSGDAGKSGEAIFDYWIQVQNCRAKSRLHM